MALDPQTGEILALVSAPSFDPNGFARGMDAATFAALRKLGIDGVIPVGARVLLLRTASHFVSLAQQVGRR